MHLEWSSVYLYNISNVNRYAPISAGVYRLSCQKDDKRLVFYVGQADNFDSRLRDHLSDQESNEYIVQNLKAYTCYFRFAEVEKQSDRNGAERALYDHFKPDCNKVVPSGPAIDINFN